MTKNGFIHTAYQLEHIIDGEQIANVEIVALIKQCDQLVGKDGPLHVSQQSNYIFVPPIREIITTDNYDKSCCCEKKCLHNKSIRFAGDTPIPTNSKMIELMEVYQQMFHNSAEIFSKLKDWVTLRIPKVEDGNNFGVEVQDYCLGVISKAWDSSLIIASRDEYFSQRALQYAAMCANPQLDDLKHAMMECDRKEFTWMRAHVIMLRDKLVGVHVAVSRNIEKISNPKPANQNHLYES